MGRPEREQPERPRPRTDDLVVGTHVLPGHVRALGIHAGVRTPDIGRDVIGEALGRIVAAHDDEDRARLTREQGCHDKGPHGRDNAQRGIVACLELGEHRLQLLRREELTL